MTVVETILVYAVVPLAIIAVLALLTLVPGRRKRLRYKPGQAWDHESIWWEPHPEHPGADDHAAPAFGAAVSGGGTKAIGSSLYGEPTGSGGEDAHAPASPAQPADAGGPRGGARGTW